MHPLATDHPRAARRAYRAAAKVERVPELAHAARRDRLERQETAAADLAAFVARYRAAVGRWRARTALTVAVAMLASGVADAAEPLASYLLTETRIAGDRADVSIADSGLTLADCALRLAVLPDPWRDAAGAVVAYGCEPDTRG